MKVLVLGVITMIGSATARRLVRCGHDVVGLDEDPGPAPRGLLPPTVRAAHGDPADRETVEATLDAFRPDRIVNAAGKTLAACIDEPDAGHRANVVMPGVVAAAAHARSIPLVHFSHKAVYGRQPVPVLAEGTPPCPETEFAADLLAGERHAAGYADRGADVRIVRICSVYGPAPQRSPSYTSRWLTEAVARLAILGRIELVGPGNLAEEYLYTSDLAEAVARITTAPGAAAGRQSVWNVGSGVATDLYGLADAMRRAFPGARVKVRLIPSEFETTYLPLDVTSMAETFGWTPRVGLARGLRTLLSTRR